MRVILTLKNLAIGKRVLTLVRDKIAHGFDKYLPVRLHQTETANLHIEKGPLWGYRLNLNIHLPMHHNLSVEEYDGNLLYALTSLREKIRCQLRKYRRKTPAPSNHC